MKIDAIGDTCPIPVIKAKKALIENRNIIIAVDNITAVENLEKMAAGLSYDFSYEKNGNNYNVSIRNNNISGKSDRIEKIPTNKTHMSVLITSDKLGSGSDELGQILIKGFIFSISQEGTTVSSIVFMNSGVKLAMKSSSCYEDLLSMQEAGINIYVCGTCVNYYNIKEQLGVGSIVDMYHITTVLSDSEKVISI